MSAKAAYRVIVRCPEGYQYHHGSQGPYWERKMVDVTWTIEDTMEEAERTVRDLNSGQPWDVARVRTEEVEG